MLVTAVLLQLLIYGAKSWPALARRERDNALSVSVTASVLCVSSGGAQTGLQRDALGTPMKTTPGNAGIVPVWEEAWTHTGQWTEYCHSLITHGQTSPEEKEVVRVHARAALCCRDVQNRPGFECELRMSAASFYKQEEALLPVQRSDLCYVSLALGQLDAITV